MEQRQINGSTEAFEAETNTGLLTYMVSERCLNQDCNPAFIFCLCTFDGDEGDFYHGEGELPKEVVGHCRTIASVLDGPNPERNALLETLIFILLTEAPNAFVSACAAECAEWLRTKGEYSSGSRWDNIADCLLRILTENRGDIRRVARCSPG
jgi:hypothetical protein